MVYLTSSLSSSLPPSSESRNNPYSIVICIEIEYLYIFTHPAHHVIHSSFSPQCSLYQLDHPACKSYINLCSTLFGKIQKFSILHQEDCWISDGVSGEAPQR